MTQLNPVIGGPFTDVNEQWGIEQILRALPEWFGIEQAILHYRDFVMLNATFTAEVEGRLVGFVSLQRHSPYSAEVYVMGVLPEYHRQGIGKALITEAEAWLIQQGVEYLQVKTLAPTDPDPAYAKTRAFYEKMGFRELEVFPNLWSEENPCLMMVKKLDKAFVENTISAVLEIPKYDPNQGVAVIWDSAARIHTEITDHWEFVISANRTGLLSLGQAFLDLADQNVPAGAHIHLDEHGFLELQQGSVAVVVVRGKE